MPLSALRERPKNKVKPELLPFLVTDSSALETHLTAFIFGRQHLCKEIWGEGIFFANGDAIDMYQGYCKAESYEIWWETINGVKVCGLYIWNPVKKDPVGGNTV